MSRQVRALLLCGVIGSLLAGCYTESRRGGGMADWVDEPEPATQPASMPAAPTSALAEPTEQSPPAAPPAPSQPAKSAEQPGSEVRAIVETNFGHMEVELWPEQAPLTVANFVKLAKSGFYENLPSDRMIPGFMVQFGKPISPAKRKELESVKGEFSETLKHEAGTLSMARRDSDPDSATSQFFICLKPRNDIQKRALASLDGKWAIFGRVVRGLDVLDAIEAVPTTRQARGRGASEPSKPTRTILLRKVRILE